MIQHNKTMQCMIWFMTWNDLKQQIMVRYVWYDLHVTRYGTRALSVVVFPGRRWSTDLTPRSFVCPEPSLKLASRICPPPCVISFQTCSCCKSSCLRTWTGLRVMWPGPDCPILHEATVKIIIIKYPFHVLEAVVDSALRSGCVGPHSADRWKFFCLCRDVSYNQIQVVPSFSGCESIQKMWALSSFYMIYRRFYCFRWVRTNAHQPLKIRNTLIKSPVTVATSKTHPAAYYGND